MMVNFRCSGLFMRNFVTSLLGTGEFVIQVQHPLPCGILKLFFDVYFDPIFLLILAWENIAWFQSELTKFCVMKINSYGDKSSYR